MLSFRNLQDVGTATAPQLMQTFFWAMFTLNTNRIVEISDWPAEGADKEIENLIRDAEHAVATGKTPWQMPESGFRAVREVPLENGDSAIVIEASVGGEMDRTAFRVRRVGNEWRVVIGKGGPQEVKLSAEQMRD